MADLEQPIARPPTAVQPAPGEFLIAKRDTACVHCWGCVRQCPTRAIRFVDGEAEIVPERCVKCGRCIKGCGNSGFAARDDLPIVRALLRSGRPVVAILATEHVAALYPSTIDELEYHLSEVGFLSVETTVVGEELVATAYENVHESNGASPPRLRSTCPVIVNWIQRFYPQLVSGLVGVVPPYIAQARLVKAIYPSDTAVVYVSPCWARKDEIHEAELAGAVDVAIGFDELKTLLAEHPVADRPAASHPRILRRPVPTKALSLTDGFPRSSLAGRDMTDGDLVIVRGLDELDRLLAGIVRGEVAPSVVDVLYCDGCVDGPAVNGGRSVFAKRNIIVSERQRQPPSMIDGRSFLRGLPAVELHRAFDARPALSRVPTTEEIDATLAEGEFASRDEVLDCGACGYDTCVEHAAAICIGASTWDMCFPLQRRILERGLVELTEQALVDSLTGLGNRRAFDKRLAEEVAHAERYGTALSLAMIDLDEFKEVNDRHGHVVGDELLKKVGSLFGEALRVSDIAMRYGGDEFAVILRDTWKTEAWVVAEKIRSALENLRLDPVGGESVSAAASIGLASFGVAHSTPESLLHAADGALYQAKRKGRNRVELAEG